MQINVALNKWHKLVFTEIKCEFLKFALISQSVNGIVILQSMNGNNNNNNNNNNSNNIIIKIIKHLD